MKTRVILKDWFRSSPLLAVALVCSVFAVQDAVGAPVMTVQYTAQVGEFDGITPVSNTVSTLERKNNYKVTNVSSENLPENHLIKLVLPAGANQGVYHAEESSDSWVVQIFANQTVFTGNGESIAPAGNLTFSIYIPDTQPLGSGLAEATAAGNGGTLDFNSVDVTIPVAFPSAYVPLFIQGNAFGFNTLAGKTYHVFHNTNLLEGAWATASFISGNGGAVYVAFDLNQDAGFYKVEEL